MVISKDLGISWKECTNIPHELNDLWLLRSVVINEDPNTKYGFVIVTVGAYNMIWMSIDGGESWIDHSPNN